MVDFYGKLVGKYKSPMDAMGDETETHIKVRVFTDTFWSLEILWPNMNPLFKVIFPLPMNDNYAQVAKWIHLSPICGVDKNSTRNEQIPPINYISC